MALTTKFFWDCECEEHYTHHRDLHKCVLCLAERDNQPDSMLEELSPLQLATINRIAERFLEEHND